MYATVVSPKFAATSSRGPMKSWRGNGSAGSPRCVAVGGLGMPCL